jgi:hypothetical protein
MFFLFLVVFANHKYAGLIGGYGFSAGMIWSNTN